MLSSLKVLCRKPITSSLPLRYIQACQFTATQQSTSDKVVYQGPSASPSIKVQIHHIDNSIWSEFEPADTDIYVNTPIKAGTTWVQEMLSQLLYNGELQKYANTDNIHDISPWLGLAILPRRSTLNQLQKQLEDDRIPRRLIRTHSPVEAISFNPKAKYIFVGRDFRDIAWSIYNHHSQFNEAAYIQLNAPRKYSFRKIPKFNFDDGSFTQRDMFRMMLTEADDSGNPDGWPWWSQLWIMGSWWNVRDLPNVKILHYNNLKADLAGSMRSIAEFCEIGIDESKFDELVEACTFQAMKSNYTAPIPTFVQGLFFKDESKFLDTGETGKWTKVLTDEDNELYRRVASRYLDEAGIRWMETGKLD